MALLLAALTGTACADGTAPTSRRPLAVSFSTLPSSGTTSAAARVLLPGHVSADVVGTSALTITRAQLVVARLELGLAGAACASDVAAGDDEEDDDDGCAELELAPSVVDLPVNGTIVDALTVNVPAGSYSSLEGRIRPIGGNRGHGHGSSAFLAAHPELDGVSVLVEGTFNGEPFRFTSDVSTGIEESFSPALTVDASPLNVTVNVDLASWFASRAGGLIDPRTAVAGGANAQLVADNIRRSFHAFRDDDRDGHDDHGGNRGRD
jgi:hypothetical protein